MRLPFGQIGAATVWPRQLPPFCELSAPRIHAHCGKRLAGNEDAVRISNARRSAFKRPAALIRLGFLELLALFEAGIVILPPGPGAAASSRESNWPVLLTFITAPAGFLLVVLRLPSTTLPDRAMFPLDGVCTLPSALAAPPLREGPVGPNGGLCESGSG